jgi:hypothetical protein
VRDSFFGIKKPMRREEKERNSYFKENKANKELEKNLHGSSCTAPSPACKTRKI